MDLFYKLDPDDGLFSLAYSRSNGEPTSRSLERFSFRYRKLTFSSGLTALLTAGSMTDSGYEYLLKQWMISGDVLAKKQCKMKLLLL